MNSKFSNQDLINATLEIYNSFEKKPHLETPQKINIDAKNSITKKVDEEQKIEHEKFPLILTKEAKDIKCSNLLKNKFDDEKSVNPVISNEKRLEDNSKKKPLIKKNKPIKKTVEKVWPMLKLNKIIKFENSKYLLLHKIKNSDLKIIKMKSPNL